MKKFAFASVAILALVGYVTADEFTATVMKVDGNTVTYVKKAGFGGFGGAGGKKAGGKADPAEQPKEEKADVTSDLKVLKGTFEFTPDPDAKKADPGAKKAGGKKGAGGFAGGKATYKAGDPIEGGLKNDVFKAANLEEKKGQFVQLTTNDAGKITQILVIEGFGGGKKGAAKKGG